MPEEVKRRHPEALCEECPLQNHGLFVPSAGPKEAKVAFVGEAAGRQEVTAGTPFIGVSGQLLTKVLGHYDIRRKDVLLTNATLCRPPGRENVSPPPGAIKACRPRLLHEIRSRGVETVVALGNVAAQSLLATTDGVSKLRVGLGRTSPYLADTRVLSTFHPAACLRSPDFFPSMVADIGKIKREVVAWKEPAYVVYDDVKSARQVIRELINYPGDRLVIDIETDTDKEEGFDHPNNYELLCIGLGYAKKKVVVLERNALKDPDVLRDLGRLLRSKKLGAQNGKYDLAGLYPRVGPLELDFDTMLASYALDERRGIHSLGIQGVEILGTPDWKDVLDPYNPRKLGYGVIPPDVLDKYNAFDVAITWELIEHYEQVLDQEGLRALHDFLVSASNELMYVELNGIAIDLEYNTQLMTSYLEVIEQSRQNLVGIIDDPEWVAFNPNSPKQVKEVIKNVFDIHIPMKRKQDGQMGESTDEETLKLLKEKQDVDSPAFTFFDSMLKHRREAKLYGTYVKGIRTRIYRGRVYPTFLLHGTTSGRLACRNPNLQNIPRQSSIRAQFVPSSGKRIFVQADYSQAELRVLTWLAQETYFRDIFNDPERDLFDELAPVLYGDLSHLDAKQKKEKRIRVKAYVYGLAYGREAGSIAQEFKISYAEAQDGMDKFFEVIPNIVAYQAEVRRQIKSDQVLTTPFGRQRRFPLLTAETFETSVKEGLAFRPQSISSDICLQAFTWARRQLKGIAQVRNIVHDSILVETDKGREDEVAEVLNRNMIASAKMVVGDYVRFATEATYGTHWGEL